MVVAALHFFFVLPVNARGATSQCAPLDADTIQRNAVVGSHTLVESERRPLRKPASTHPVSLPATLARICEQPRVSPQWFARVSEARRDQRHTVATFARANREPVAPIRTRGLCFSPCAAEHRIAFWIPLLTTFPRIYVRILMAKLRQITYSRDRENTYRLR